MESLKKSFALKIAPVIGVIFFVFGFVCCDVVSLLFPKFDGDGPLQKIQRTEDIIRSIEGGLMLYYAKHGAYPTDLRALVAENLIEGPIKDAWGHELVYEAEGSSYEIISYGADAKPGGEGAAADITGTGLHPKRTP